MIFRNIIRLRTRYGTFIILKCPRSRNGRRIGLRRFGRVRHLRRRAVGFLFEEVFGGGVVIGRSTENTLRFLIALRGYPALQTVYVIAVVGNDIFRQTVLISKHQCLQIGQQVACRIQHTCHVLAIRRRVASQNFFGNGRHDFRRSNEIFYRRLKGVYRFLIFAYIRIVIYRRIVGIYLRLVNGLYGREEEIFRTDFELGIRRHDVRTCLFYIVYRGRRNLFSQQRIGHDLCFFVDDGKLFVGGFHKRSSVPLIVGGQILFIQNTDHIPICTVIGIISGEGGNLLIRYGRIVQNRINNLCLFGGIHLFGKDVLGEVVSDFFVQRAYRFQTDVSFDVFHQRIVEFSQFFSEGFGDLQVNIDVFNGEITLFTVDGTCRITNGSVGGFVNALQNLHTEVFVFEIQRFKDDGIPDVFQFDISFVGSTHTQEGFVSFFIQSGVEVCRMVPYRIVVQSGLIGVFFRNGHGGYRAESLLEGSRNAVGVNDGFRNGIEDFFGKFISRFEILAGFVVGVVLRRLRFRPFVDAKDSVGYGVADDADVL